jgi:hypothetical protein
MRSAGTSHTLRRTGRELGLDHRQDGLNDLAKCHSLDLVLNLACLDPSEVQHIVDKFEKVALALGDFFDGIGLRGSRWAVDPHLDELRVPADCIERRAQLVAHHRQERALRPVRLLSRRPEPFELHRALLQVIVETLQFLALRLQVHGLVGQTLVTGAELEGLAFELGMRGRHDLAVRLRQLARLFT